MFLVSEKNRWFRLTHCLAFPWTNGVPMGSYHGFFDRGAVTYSSRLPRLLPAVAGLSVTLQALPPTAFEPGDHRLCTQGLLLGVCFIAGEEALNLLNLRRCIVGYVGRDC